MKALGFEANDLRLSHLALAAHRTGMVFQMQ